MLASLIVFDVSRDLNDQVRGYTYVRWSEDQLYSYYKEALAACARIDKEPFMHTVVTLLQSGAGWQTACDCSEIKHIVGECDEDGTVLGYATERSDDNAYTWPGTVAPHCPWDAATSASVFTGYKLNKYKRNEFAVVPPVIAGQRRYALVECYRDPDLDDKTFDVPDHFVQIIKQWMLYRALIVDSENNSAIAQIANVHLQEYNHLISLLIREVERDKEEEHERDNTVRAVQTGSAK